MSKQAVNEVPKPQFDLLRFIVEGITDRDAPSLYGSAPERDLFELWSDKVELTDGSDWEKVIQDDVFVAKARDLFSERVSSEGPVKLGLAFAQSPSMTFIRAIFDAVNDEKKILARIVVQSKDDFERVAAQHLPTRAGRVPERHWVELQHQMVVGGFERAYFVSTIDGTQTSSILVTRDPVFVSNHVAECVFFWDHVRRGSPPPGAIIPPDVDPDKVEEPESGQLSLTNEQEHA